MGCWAALVVFFCFSVLTSGQTSCNIKTLGAVGDGHTLNTAIIQKAFDTCDEVIIPNPGTYLTGALNITRDNFTLNVHGTLLAPTNPSAFNIMPHLPSYPCDRDICTPFRYQPFILAFNVSNLVIQGSGTIDGNGTTWWTRYHSKTLIYGRPRLLETMYCKHVRILGVTLKDSPFWTTHIYASDYIEIGGITVHAPGGPNTDGIDPDSSTYLWAHDCEIYEGDDCIAVKSGLNEAGRLFNRPSAHILFERITCRGHSLAIGSEMSGGVHNVTFRDITLNKADRGGYVKTSPLRGGYVRDIYYEGILAKELTQAALVLQTSYGNGENRPEDFGAEIAMPIIENIVFRNIRGTAKQAGSFICADNIRCTNITLDDIDMKSPEGFECKYVSGSTRDVFPKPCF